MTEVGTWCLPDHRRCRSALDIAQLEAVINVDITPDPEVHVHRVGRAELGSRLESCAARQPLSICPRGIETAPVDWVTCWLISE